MGWGIAIALAVSIVIAYLLFHAFKKLLPLILHGIAGLAVFWLLNNSGMMKIPLDLATFVIAALGGVFGVIIVIVLALAGVPL